MCLEQDLGRERVEERETGVMIKEVGAALEEVDAMSRKFCLPLNTLCGKELEANLYHTILVEKHIWLCKSTRCFICKKKSHYAKDCRNKKDKAIRLLED